jgi:hypothetical protein
MSISYPIQCYDGTLLQSVKKGLLANFVSAVRMVLAGFGFFQERPEPVFLSVYGAQESILRNEFRQPM